MIPISKTNLRLDKDVQIVIVPTYFNKVDARYWLENYSLWTENDYVSNVFDANPFFEIKNAPDFIPRKEDFVAIKQRSPED
jgi:hypothetical protein